MYQHKTMPGKANNVITGDHIRPNQHAVSQFFSQFARFRCVNPIITRIHVIF